MNLSAISNNKGESPRSMKSHQPNCLRLHFMLLEMPNNELLKEEFSTIDFLWLRRVIVDQSSILKQSLAKYGQVGGISLFTHAQPLPDRRGAQMIHRCKKLIFSTSQWKSNGILMHNEETRLVKSAKFRNAWKSQIIIMRNRIKITNKGAPVVEVPNDVPAKVSEANSVMTEVSVAAPRPLLEGRQNSTKMITTTEPLIKVDPDGPVDLVDEVKTVSRVKLEHLDSEQVQPVLRDTSLNVTDETYHCSPSHCHGLPDFESDVPDSQVPPPDTTSISRSGPSRNSIMAEVIFLKDSKRINYSSEALLSDHTQKFKACARITVLTPNKIGRKVVRDAMSVIWDSNHELVLFWKSVALRTSTIIEITFPDATWLPGVTVDTNSDDDLLRARQVIWNSFWIFLAKQPETIISTFNINATPESPKLGVALSKRQRNSIPDDPISRHQEDGTSPCSNDAYDIAFRNYVSKISSQRSYENSGPREGIQSIGQAPISPKSLPLLKRPAKRPRLIEQQLTTAQTELATTTSNPILWGQQIQQQMPEQQTHQQQHGSRPVHTPAGSHILGSVYHPPPQPFIQAQSLQPNSIRTQPRTSLPSTKTAVFHHEPNGAFASYACQATPRTNHSSRSQTSLAMPPTPSKTHENMPSQRIPRMLASTLTSSYQYSPYTHASAPMSPPETRARSQRSPPSAHHPPSMPTSRLSHHIQTFNHPELPQSPPITPQSHRFPSYPPSHPTPTPTIQFRIQLQPNGPFSPPYPKSVLGIPGKPAITTSQFFACFTANTNPIRGKNPDSLTFRLKDAVPAPIAYTVSRTGIVDGVDALVKLRADIKRECENAGRLVMGLEKFEIYVSITEETDTRKEVELPRQVLGEEW
ncbi:uncharacterized protein Bfra_001135 [Botrytis fragariae]|uniref:Uncharacterized protein n=1 Tax=Botrytis fragariae TaxID=1964551 RepID=A0A8H6B4Q7_9HELO|nr:uncharacterized protein Bfra_001135 [Botrytis fragariae]KAF5878962.1 hypothetical protein Bfra_001135 [Botrytis fragariae]